MQGKIDPYTNSAFGFKNKLARVIWWAVYVIFFRLSPKPMFGWRRFLLRLFGAKIGRGVAVYPGAHIWAPWNLVCADMVAVANGVNIYNPEVITLNSHAIISQDSYLCGATHDYNDPDFPLISKEIIIDSYAWICARACVMPGVKVGEGAILGMGGIATRNLSAWGIYVGSPAKFVRTRDKFFIESKNE